MCDEGEKTCPLCAEEMDLTDQQLKPCKCGYQICVWCWHHIMDMAEKDEAEGRCPACRVPYDKEKIVGTTANCERLVAEINTEKKIKSQKAKTKSAEGRKQLSSVRVIQRNLVYIIGLPLNLADEDILQRREYFGQYGKVLKVSMSRTAGGAIQQFPNNTCSVYITYLKEEEAIRCIQSVHGFVLDGRPLRACFGTTKYCHAWLRNVPCTNPDCLYLHEVGSQDDSFTKDEIISAYTRTRVQQITGNAYCTQRRMGSVLPPPLDDNWNSSLPSAGKPVVKVASNNAASMIKRTLGNGNTGRAPALPAAASWGLRAPNSQSQAANLGSSDRPSKEKLEAVNGLPASLPGANPVQPTQLHSNGPKKQLLNDGSQAIATNKSLDSLICTKQHSCTASDTLSPDKYFTVERVPVTNIRSDRPSSSVTCEESRNIISVAQENIKSIGTSLKPASTCLDKQVKCKTDGMIQNLSHGVSSLSVHGDFQGVSSYALGPEFLISEPGWIGSTGDQGLQQQLCAKQSKSSSASVGVSDAVPSNTDTFVSTDELPTMRTPSEEDKISFNMKRLEDPEIVNRLTYLTNSTSLCHVPKDPTSHSLQHLEVCSISKSAAGPFAVDSGTEHRNSAISNGFLEESTNDSAGLDRAAEVRDKKFGLLQGGVIDVDNDVALEAGENSIISDILSLDFDSWSDSLTSPQHLAKLLGKLDKQQGSVKTPSYLKIPNSNRSRFSFARQDDPMSHAFDVDSLFSVPGQIAWNSSAKDFHEYHQSYSQDPRLPNGALLKFEEAGSHTGGQFSLSTSKGSVSRSQMSAPPGFAVPSKAPPPGFSSHERIDRNFDASGNHFSDTPFLRNPYQTTNESITSSGDIEFIDPAILAVGRGRIQGGMNNPVLDLGSFTQCMNTLDSDSGFDFLMEGSFPAHSNVRYNTGASYTSPSECFDFASMIYNQPQVGELSAHGQLSLQQNRNSLMPNGHWEGWNAIPSGGGLAMAELLRNERLGLNKFYGNLDNSKYKMRSPGDLYNRTFGM